MKEDIVGFIEFLVGGIVIAFWLFMALVPDLFTQATDALEQCERTLPRDQKCVIIAIPKDKK